MSSPRMWGCFFFQKSFIFFNSVFPTHVGVFLYRSLPAYARIRLPHACGGVSCASSTVFVAYCVFPTHVGVFLHLAA